MTNNTQPTEAQIRQELGIPPIGDPSAQKVIIEPVIASRLGLAAGIFVISGR